MDFWPKNVQKDILKRGKKVEVLVKNGNKKPQWSDTWRFHHSTFFMAPLCNIDMVNSGGLHLLSEYKVSYRLPSTGIRQASVFRENFPSNRCYFGFEGFFSNQS